MRVLMIGSDTTIFNTESAARSRLRSYASHIGELHILSRVGKGSKSGVVKDGPLTLHGVNTSRLFAPFLFIKLAWHIITENNIEVVSAQDPFEHGFAAWCATRTTTAKLHMQVHTDFLSPWFVRTSLLNRIRVRIADHILMKADGIRVVSKRVRDNLISRYGGNIQIPSVIPIAVSNNTPTAVPLPLHPFAFTLITVSRLEKEKRIGDIFKALARIKKRYPSVGLFVVGDGRQRHALEEQSRVLGLSENVVFLGARSDARGLMLSADVFIQASAYEGYGLTLIEAALAGVPIITTDVGIVGDILLSDRDALVCPVGDIEHISEAIMKLFDENTLCELLTTRAREAVERHLVATSGAVERIVQDFKKLLPTYD